jgi:hypothetical protein
MHQLISRKAELYKPRNGEAGTETCRVVKPSSVKTNEPPSSYRVYLRNRRIRTRTYGGVGGESG